MAAPERDDQRDVQRRHAKLPQAVLWILFTTGCHQSRVASAAQSTLTAKTIPPGSRTWHSAGYHLTPRHGWHKMEGFTHVSRLDPFPRSTELLSSATDGNSIGKQSKTTTGLGTDCALIVICPRLWYRQSQGARAVLPWEMIFPPGRLLSLQAGDAFPESYFDAVCICKIKTLALQGLN